MKKLVLALGLLVSTSVFADKLPGVPACDVSPDNVRSDVGNAGCLVKIEGKLLMIRHLKKGKIGIPGGHQEKEESAQCTAHRETWEETGLNVRVGKLLKKFKNGFFLFQCEAKDVPKIEGDKLPLPEWAKNEVTEVWVKDPKTIDKKDYRFPKQLTEIQQLFSTL